jgi:hypothetical protein
MDETPDKLDWDSGCWDVIQAQSDYIEFDWFARDVAGCLAVLSSFGIGPSPAIVRASRPDFNAVLRLFSQLEETTTAIVDPMASGRTVDWEHYARRGIFGYDNADINGGDPRYERIASPKDPLPFRELSIPQALVTRIPVLPVIFSQSSSIFFTSIPT